MIVTLEHAQANLAGLIHQLPVGEPLIITENDRPVARLTAEAPPTALPPRVPGLLKGFITIVAEDDDHLKDFEEYMS